MTAANPKISTNESRMWLMAAPVVLATLSSCTTVMGAFDAPQIPDSTWAVARNNRSPALTLRGNTAARESLEQAFKSAASPQGYVRVQTQYGQIPGKAIMDENTGHPLGGPIDAKDLSTVFTNAANMLAQLPPGTSAVMRFGQMSNYGSAICTRAVASLNIANCVAHSGTKGMLLDSNNEQSTPKFASTPQWRLSGTALIM